MAKKKRTKIPDDKEADILFINDHKCCICHRGTVDIGVRIQIHHINGKPYDHRLENLATVCLECHHKLNDEQFMGRRFSPEEVKKYKQDWESAVSKKRKHSSFPSAIVKVRETIKENGMGKKEHNIEREIIYTNGLAPTAFGVSPPISLSNEKKSLLNEAKKIVISKKDSEKLMSILSKIKETDEINIEDMSVLSRVCLSIGDNKYIKGDYSMAEIFYKEALGYAKTSNETEIVALCLYELGASVGMQGRHKEALKQFNSYIELDKKNPYAWTNKGVSLAAIRKYEESLFCFNEAIKLKPDYASAWLFKCNLLDDENKSEEALTCVNESIRLSPNDYKAWYSKGIVLDKLNRIEESIKSYEKSIELNPKRGEPWVNIGAALSNKYEKYKEAITYFKKAIEINPKIEEAWSGMGVTLNNMYKYKEAIKYFKKAIEINPNYVTALSGMGVALGKIGKHEEAISYFKKAIETQPNDANALYNRACFYSLIGKKKEALSDLISAIKIESGYKEYAKKDEDFKNLVNDKKFIKISK